MSHTRYADMHLPEKRPTEPLLIGALVSATVAALVVAGCFALASPRRNPRPTTPVVADKPAEATKKPRAKGRATLVTRDEKVRQRVVLRGRGPIESVVQPGSPGVRRVTRNSVSNKIVSSVVVRKSVPTVVVRSESTRGKLVALTFDDGPHPTQTRQILSILQAENVRATFFMVGRMARYHPEAARAVAAAGMLIGDHTESHASLPSMTVTKVAAQIAKGQSSIKSVTGVTTEWFRSPYGAADPSTRLAASKLGMRVATWNVDPDDWRNPSAASITRYVVRHVRPGSIVLLHDGGGSNRAHTIESLPTIIKELKKRGYRFVTLDQL